MTKHGKHLSEAEVHKVKQKLFAQARQQGFGEQRTRKYVFGALRKLGWRRSSEKKS